MVQLQVDVKHGVDPAKVEAAIAEEWARFLKDGPTDDELARVKVSARASFIRHLERVNGKASILAEGQVYRGDPGAYKSDLARLEAATPASVLAAANKWIAHGDYTLTVTPAPEGADEDIKDEMEAPGRAAIDGRPAAVMPAKAEYQVAKSAIARDKGVPKVDAFPDLKFPKLERGKLKNGIEVMLAQRHAIPVVQTQLLFDAGYASRPGPRAGTSAFTMAMLDEGTGTLDSLEIARREERLGAEISAGSGLDTSSVSLNALTSQLAPSLALYADIVRNPAFRDEDIARVRGQWLARIAQEKTQPRGLALRTLPPLLVRRGPRVCDSVHRLRQRAGDQRADREGSARVTSPIACVRTTRRSSSPATRRWTRSSRELDAGVRRLESAVGAAAEEEHRDRRSRRPKPRVYLMDKPGAQQSLILAGVVAPSTKAKNDLEIQTMNGAFGGTFTSRLNMNLREDKHWAYGAFSFLTNALGQRPFLLYAPVQTDKTAESAAELLRESKEVIGAKPLTRDEIEKIKVGDVRSMPGEYQTTGAVLGALTGIVVYDRPDDYVQTLKPRIEAQTDPAVQAAANEIIKPDALTWVIVGDLKKIEKPVRALNLGEVKVLDAEGKVVR